MEELVTQVSVFNTDRSNVLTWLTFAVSALRKQTFKVKKKKLLSYLVLYCIKVLSSGVVGVQNQVMGFTRFLVECHTNNGVCQHASTLEYHVQLDKSCCAIHPEFMYQLWHPATAESQSCIVEDTEESFLTFGYPHIYSCTDKPC